MKDKKDNTLIQVLRKAKAKVALEGALRGIKKRKARESSASTDLCIRVRWYKLKIRIVSK